MILKDYFGTNTSFGLFITILVIFILSILMVKVVIVEKGGSVKDSVVKDLTEDRIVWTIVTGWKSGSSNSPISDDGLAILIDEIMTNL